MEDKILIDDIVSRCLKYFTDNCYTIPRIKRYQEYWKSGIIAFLKTRGTNYLTDALVQEFLETCVKDGTVRHQEREMMRSVYVLSDLWHKGKISYRNYIPAQHNLTGPIGEAMEVFITHMCNLRRGISTLRSYRLYLHNFASYLQTNDIRKVSEITESHVMRYVIAQDSNRANIVSALRMLFRYWKETGVTEYDLEEAFAGTAIKKKEKIPSFYTEEEVMRIEASVDRSNSVGKRDYAMLLLADRLGLRASDIAGLEFSNIDWDNSIIHLVQYKTKVHIELPLLSDVGNAIIDYLRYGRPKSDTNNVFLSARAPFRKATAPTVSAALGRAILNSGVDVSGRHHGPHSMRHSLASALLCNGTSIPVISESLGHKSSNTTMTYLKIDMASLQKCALPVPVVSDEFYMQKGGMFYE